MPDPLTMFDDGPPDPDDEVLVGEVLDPETLVPVVDIMRRVEGITAADVARSTLMAETALAVTVITTDEQQAFLDNLRDQMKAHQGSVEAKLETFISIANRLHKGLTGLRSSALGRVPDAVKHAGNLLAAYLRQKQEAEAARQREAQRESTRRGTRTSTGRSRGCGTRTAAAG